MHAYARTYIIMQDNEGAVAQKRVLRSSLGPPCSMTKRFAVLEPQNISSDEFRVVQKRRSTDFEASPLWDVP